MNKRLISITLVTIVIIILLASFDVYFYFENNRVREELHESRVDEAYLVAYDIARRLLSFTGTFYRTIHDLNSTLTPENTQYNESKMYAIAWKSSTITTSAENSWTDIRGDFGALRTLAYVDEEIPFFNQSGFDAVYEALREALGQAAWATMGKTADEMLNETPAFLWDLYYVLGIDQVERSIDREWKD
jgi:hypothetical protein